MNYMTPEQYQEIISRFDIVDQRFARVDVELQKIHFELAGKANRDDVFALHGKIDDLAEQVNGFVSDVNDRLSRKIDKVTAWVKMPAEQLLDENRSAA